MDLIKHAKRLLAKVPPEYGVAEFNNFSGSISTLNEMQRPHNEYINYHRYIVSAVWQLRRELYLEHFQICQECGKKFNNLRPAQLHHLTYRRLGVENLDDVQLICKKCHYRKEVEKSLNCYQE
jgi:5-methylcytosine-specific restriction endonuclease McrA